MIIIPFSIISILIFFLLKYLVIKYDEEHGIIIKKYDNLIIFLFCIINNVIIYNTKFNIITQITLMLSFSILLVCSYTDIKTNFVYRIYSYFIIMVNIIYLLLNNKFINSTNVLTLIMFSAIVWILTSNNCFGKGDAYILIANSFLMITFNKNSYFPIEIILWHFLIAVLLMIVLNIRQMNFKTLRFKKPIAFVPYIYLSSLVIMIGYFLK